MSKQSHSDIDRSLVIATRGSRLALWQAEHIKSLLHAQGIESDIKIVKTKGDRVQDRLLHEIGGKGVFIKEIEQALLDQTADLAIHSLKDLPANLAPEFAFAAVLPRHHSGDALILGPNAKVDRPGEDSLLTRAQFKKFKKFSVGSGSLRRASLLKVANAGVDVQPIRGNVDTRLARLRAGEWDSIILAKASLDRLDLANDLDVWVLDPEWFVPSPSQGALLIETLASFPRVRDIAPLGCRETRFRVELERAVLLGLGGDCTLPIGAHAWFVDLKGTKELRLNVVVLDQSGMEARVQLSWTSPDESPYSLAQKTLRALVDANVNPVLKSLGLNEIEAP